MGTVQYLDTWQLNRRQAPTLTQQVQAVARSILGVVATGSVSGLNPTMLSLWADVSHWNGALDSSIIANVDGLMIKACDGKQILNGSASDLANYVDDYLYKNVQACYDAGKPCILYIYWQPLQNDPSIDKRGNAPWHFRVLQKALGSLVPGKSFHGIAIDVEESGDTDTNTSDKVLALYALIKAAYPDIPIFFYSSNGYLSGKPALRDSLSFQGAPYNLWLAQWVYSKLVSTTWDEIKTKYIPTINMKVVTPGYATWKFVQWTGGAFKCPGFQIPLDLNFFIGDKDHAYAMLNYKPGTVTPPVDTGGGDDTNNDTTDPDLTALTARVTALETWAKNIQMK